MGQRIVSVFFGIIVISGTVLGYVNYEYYEGTWDQLPDFESLNPEHTGLTSNFDINLRDQEDNFAFRFSAMISITREGDYTFTTVSDDGSRLYIDNVLVVDNDGLHGSESHSGTIFLTQEQHTITVTYFEKGGSNILYVLYQGPDFNQQRIPDEVLSPIEVPAGYKACCPTPADMSPTTDPAVTLRWEAPTLVDAPEYDIYFSTDPNFPEGALVTSQTTTMYDPYGEDSLSAGTSYYWRIDVYDPNIGLTPAIYTGDVWSFTTSYGLVALYEFETGPDDSTESGHDGTYMGQSDPNIVKEELRGNVLLLNEDGQVDEQYVEIGSVGISGDMPRSITGWARANTTSIPDWTNVFGFSPAAGSGGNYFDVQVDSGGNYVLHVHGWEQPFCPVDVQWHHFAATYDGAIIKWYLDGVLIGMEIRELATMDEFRIGSRQSHNTYFPGYVDDVAVWDVALSAEQIREQVLFADFDGDMDVDLTDLGNLTSHWLDSTLIPDSIEPPMVLEDFEVYSSTGFPPITMGWFKYLSDSGKGYPTFTLLTGQTDSPYGGSQAMRLDYQFTEGWTADDWLVLGHRITVADISGYDEIRFRVKYHADNTDDVGLFLHAGDDPPDVTEREAFQVGPFSTMDNPSDPNQWHEISINLRNDDMVNWMDPYTGIEDIHYMNGILIGLVNTSGEPRSGTLHFDDFRLIDYTPDCDGFPVVDLNADCVVDLRDFAILAEEWLRDHVMS